MTGRASINPIAWLLWFIAVAAIPVSSRHPLYLTLALMVVSVVHLSIPADERGSSPWRLFAYVGSSVAVLSIAFNVLTVHSGDRPFAELPDWWPIIGGQLTYNALLYGVASALAISAVLFAAATFNTAVSHTALMRLIPRPFRQIGAAGSIALNYVPQTIQAGRDIYDVQRARGHQMRGVRDARAFMVPLLGNGLERAVQTSEALETRGYGYDGSTGNATRLPGWRMWSAVLLAGVALPLLATGRILMALLVALLAVLVAFARFRRGATRSRGQPWTIASIVVAVAAATMIAVLVATIASGDGLAYSPFPRLVWPDLNLLIASLLCLQILPAFLVSGNLR